MNGSGGARSGSEIPLYPVDRSFVVHFHRDSAGNGDDCAGRVEHLATGKTRRFANGGELHRFVREILDAPSQDGEPPPCEPA